MARVFDELELGHLREVLASGRLGWASGGWSPASRRPSPAWWGIASPSGATRRRWPGPGRQPVPPDTGYEVICDPIVHFGGLAAVSFSAMPRFADVRRAPS